MHQLVSSEGLLGVETDKLPHSLQEKLVIVHTPQQSRRHDLTGCSNSKGSDALRGHRPIQRRGFFHDRSSAPAAIPAAATATIAATAAVDAFFELFSWPLRGQHRPPAGSCTACLRLDSAMSRQ